MILAPTTIAQPDLLVLSKQREHLVTERAVEGPPDLPVEILPPSSIRQDRITKTALYARFGVPHYWVVDPQARTVEIYILDGDTYRLAAAHAERDSFQPALFPGLTIDLAKVWP